MSIVITKKPKKGSSGSVSPTASSKGAVSTNKKSSMSFTGKNNLVPDLQVECLPIESFKPAHKNLRKNVRQQVKRLLPSVLEFGQVAPILVDENLKLIDGQMLLETLRELGASHINCCKISHLTDEQLRLLRIALNTIQTKAEWDPLELGAELIELDSMDFDLSITGLEIAELDSLMLLPGKLDQEDIPETPDDPISKPGDLWHLGEHRLFCGNALDEAAYTTVLGATTVQLIFTDPPYNLKIKNNVSGLGKVKHDDFAMGVGEMSDEEFRGFLSPALSLSADRSDKGSVFFVCMDWRQIHNLQRAAEQSGLHHINTCVWDKGNGGMGALYRSRHEFVAVFCTNPVPAINNIQLGKFGRSRTNVWQYPGANSKGSSANDALHLHATPKPVELVEDAILDVTKPKARVLDPFIGSGTTILAAERTNRIAHGIELEPKFVDVAIIRWQEMTSKKAVHASTGLPFGEEVQS